MEIYDIVLHFPARYGILQGEELALTSREYYKNADEAIRRAKNVAGAFVTPRPDFYYIEGEGKVWTNNPEEVKAYTHYDKMLSKPLYLPVT